jgi:hypothetical protein
VPELVADKIHVHVVDKAGSATSQSHNTHSNPLPRVI